jgi:hypothetical protein
MAEKTEKPDAGPVRYRVKAATFVNGTYVDPRAANPVGCEIVGKQCFVTAPAGLEGAALELVKGKAAEPKPPEG